MEKKILSVIGARPQFVKEAIVQRALRERGCFNEVLVHTGQHFDVNMSDTFFKTLNIKTPDHYLGISGGSHGEMTGRMLIELEQLMMKEDPDLVLLYGDTNSTLAAAIAAAKLKIAVAHVEAGLRQEPRDMPEEINRVLTDHISAFLFAPSDFAMENLQREGIADRASFTGDVMFDVFLEQFPLFDRDYKDELGLTAGRYVVMTLHRDFNVDVEETLTGILESVNEINKQMPVVLPLHPRTRQRVSESGLEHLIEQLVVTEPLDYLKLMGLTQDCYMAITDSGGFQKETYFSGKNALVLMPDTSWIELVDNGINVLVDSDSLIDGFEKHANSDFLESIYGDGTAAHQIAHILEENL